ncbi:alpha/beta fold hydrolase [Nocardioides stalactiti]|uniref:alpha/beta fold hydrolase n=1 Tax=Nocardioides stalactiti TaxID=2755356 RepID=UPI0016026FA8|nr:alpha/beta fold hydrolase [Nocardioides stalactiti]
MRAEPAPGATTNRLTAIERDGLTFGVIDAGPIDGPPVVLLHGFPQRATTWAPTTALLNQAGFRTYALDQRGYAPGARPRGRRAYRMAELVDDVVALIDRIGGPVVVVGHDWGAGVAWNVATRHPDRVSHLVAASVPHPAAFFASMVRSNQLLMSAYMGFFQLPVVPELFTRFGWMRWWLRRSGMPADAVTRWEREFAGRGCLRGALGWYRALPFLEPRLVGTTSSIPTTFVWSTEDWFLGRKGAELTPQWVSGPYRYVELDGSSHWLMDEHPGVLAAQVIAGPPR